MVQNKTYVNRSDPQRTSSTAVLTLVVAIIDHLKTFKLLGVHVTDDLEWSHHIDVICFEAASRLHFLKLLVRSGAALGDLVGQIFAMFILTVAAAEAAIGLAIVVVYFRNRGSIQVEDVNLMKG